MYSAYQYFPSEYYETTGILQMMKKMCKRKLKIVCQLFVQIYLELLKFFPPY